MKVIVSNAGETIGCSVQRKNDSQTNLLPYFYCYDVDSLDVMAAAFTNNLSIIVK